ncbi:MAG: choice-of-anchor D domain-containing protein [bacterium]
MRSFKGIPQLAVVTLVALLTVTVWGGSETSQQVDTEIWSQSYWQDLAYQGLVEVAPEIPVKEAVYTSSEVLSRGVLIDDSPDVPVTDDPNNTQSENSIFIHPFDLNTVLNSNNSTPWPVSGIYGANALFSTDGGAVWGGSLAGAGGSNRGDPAAVIGLNGWYYVGYIASNSGQGVAYSTNNGATFTHVQAAPNPGSLADKNHLWIDNSSASPYEGNLYSAWTAFGGADDREVVLVRSTDSGLTWSLPLNISSAVAAGSHDQGVNIKTGTNGEVYAVWSIYDSWPSDETAIGMAVSTDGGATFAPATRIIQNIRGIRITTTSKNMRCNSFPAMEVDISGGPHDGNLYVVWTNIGIPGINTGPDMDVYIAKSTDGGGSWSTPLKVNQDPSGLGKEHFFPWIACDPVNGMLSVIFYDDRNVASTDCEVFVAVSADAGDTWMDFKVSDVSFTPSPIPGLAGGYFGDYLGISARSGMIYPCWTDNRQGSGRAMTYVSPIVLEKDSIPPDAVTDLAVAGVGSNWVELTWTASGDDTDSGKAGSYDIRYSTSPIDSGNFESVTEVSPTPSPQDAGTTELFKVTGLDFSTTYYFALKVGDEWANTSGVSNSPGETTLGIPDISVVPDTLFDSLFTGDQSTQTIYIKNEAGGPSTVDFFVPQFGGEASLRVTGGEGDQLSLELIPVSQTYQPQYPTERLSGKDHLLPVGQGSSHSLLDLRMSSLDTDYIMFYDDMESGINGWTEELYGGTTDDLWHQTNTAYNSAVTSWWCADETVGTYATGNLISTAVVSPLIDLSIGTAPITLEFYETYDTEPGWDYCMVDVSTDDGGSWVPLRGAYGMAPSGSSGGWILTVLDLSAYEGQVIRLRFYFDTGDGGANDYTGWFFDDVLVTTAAFSFLSMDPAAGSIAAGDSLAVDVTFDATGMFGGDYDMTVEIYSNDPDEPIVNLAAFMNVTGAPDIALSTDSLDYDSVFVNAVIPQILVVSNGGTDLLSVTGISSDHGFYTVDTSTFDLDPGQSQPVVVTFAPTSAGDFPATLTIENNDLTDSIVTVTLLGRAVLPPVILVSPDSISDSLYTGEIALHTLTIENDGVSDLIFDITVEGDSSLAIKSVNINPGDVLETVTGGTGDLAFSSITPYTDGYHASREPLSPGDIVPGNLMPYTIDVLLLYSGSYPSEIKGLLESYPDIDLVGTYDASSGAPGLGDLLPYHSVIVMNGVAWGDPVGTGNVLADYIDAGGSVVVTLASFVSGFGISGRFVSGGYAPFNIGFGPAGSANLGSFNAAHPIMKNVTTASGDILGDITIASGAQLVAEWDNGLPMVATQTGGVVAVNVYVPDAGYWAGDIPLILHNALFWGAVSGEFVQLDSTSGVLHSGQSMIIEVALIAIGMNGGDYYADILIHNNDPVDSLVSVPVHLHVTGAPDLAVSADTLDFDSVFVNDSLTQALMVSNVGTDSLVVTDISSSHADYSVDITSFVLYPLDSQVVQVKFKPGTTTPIPGILTITCNDPDEPTYAVTLLGEGAEAPTIAVSPDSLSDSLLTGETSVHLLTIANTKGDGADLIWQASTEVFEESLKKSFLLTPPDPGAKAAADDEPTSDRSSVSFRTTSIEAQLADLTDVYILFDRSHGQGSTSGWLTIISDLEARGATVTENFDTLTPGLLDNYDIYWTVDINSPFSGAELTAMTNWVLGGGGVVLEGDNTSTVPIYNSLLSALGSGIEYSDVDGASGGTSNIFPHETTTDVDSVILSANVAHLSAVAAPAQVLIDDTMDVANSACEIVSSGRIVAMADEIFTNSRMGLANNQLFANQVFDWLAAGVSWLKIDSTSGSVAGGTTVDIPVTFDAFRMFGGVYQALIVVTSNDIYNSIVYVPAWLHVTGAPDIVLSDTAMDFDTVFVGGSSTDTLLVTNQGTDTLIVGSITSSHADYDVDMVTFNLAPGESQPVIVTFQPATPTLITADLTVNSNDPDQPVLTVQLSGVGILPPQIAVAPDSLSDSLYTGDTSSHILTIANTATDGSDLIWEASTVPSDTVASKLYTLTAPNPNTETPDLEAEDGIEAGEPRTTPIEAMLDDLTDVQILWDQSHGQTTTSSWSTLIADLQSRGATVTVNFDPISATLLADYDVFWTVDINSPFTNGEVKAIAPWLKAGGGLLLEGDNASTVGIYNALLEALEAGIHYIGISGAPGISGDILSHETTTDVDSIYFSGNVAYLDTVVAPAGVLVNDAGGTPACAYSEVVSGHIVAMSDEVFLNSHLAYADNQLFGNQVFDWLVGGVGWLRLDTTTGVIPAGASTDVNVTFDATGLPGGLYTADIIIRSNDPDDSAVAVAAGLHVTGAPNIFVSDTIVGFGSVFLGGTVAETLMVSNNGTDSLFVYDISSDNSDFAVDITSFALNLGESQPVAVTFTPSAIGGIAGNLTITSNDIDEPTVVVALIGMGVEPPDIAVAPTSMFQHLITGDTATQLLTISNVGVSNLTFTVAVENVTTPAMGGIALSGTDQVSHQQQITVSDPGTDNESAVYELPPWTANGVDEQTYIRLLNSSRDKSSDSDISLQVSGFNSTGTESAISTVSGGMIEDFDTTATWPWAPWVVVYSGGSVTGGCAHDGPQGIGDPNWHYRTDVVIGAPGEKLEMWTKVGTGRWYMGFGASAAGAWSLVAAPNTDKLYIQFNNGYSFQDLDSVYQTYVIGQWYKLEIVFGEGNQVTGNLYDSDGITLLNTVSSTLSGFAPAGVAIRSFSGFCGDSYSTGGLGWVSASPTSGTVVQDSSMTIAIKFDATDLYECDYFADIIISSNDPDEPTVTVPVHLHVTGAAQALTITDPDTMYAAQAYTVDSLIGSIFVGDFPDSHIVGDIDPTSLIINDSIAVLTTSVVPLPDGFYCDAMELTFLMRDFILDYPLLWDTTQQDYTVSGKFDDSTSFTATGTVMMIGHVSGDVDGNGRVSIGDLTYLVAYLFQGGAPPPVMEAADADGSCGLLDVGDLTWLVQYLFMGGPQPLGCR